MDKRTTIAVGLAKSVFEVLNAFELRVDQPLDTPGRFEALAHALPGGAYPLAVPADYTDQRLYRLIVEIFTTEDLGATATLLAGYVFVYAIAATPRRLGPGIVEVPAVSRTGLVVLAMLLAIAAVWRARRLA